MRLSAHHECAYLLSGFSRLRMHAALLTTGSTSGNEAVLSPTLCLMERGAANARAQTCARTHTNTRGEKDKERPTHEHTHTQTLAHAHTQGRRIRTANARTQAHTHKGAHTEPGFLREGGMWSWGSTGGTGVPPRARAIMCMASANCSGSSCPVRFMSTSPLRVCVCACVQVSMSAYPCACRC